MCDFLGFMNWFNILTCFFQVKIQKDSEVRLKIIGTRVDATEIVCLSLYFVMFSFLSTD